MTLLRKNIEHEMALKSWNAYDLSEKSGVPQPTIHRFLSGKIGDPRSETIRKLAKGLGTTEEKLRGFGVGEGDPAASTVSRPERFAEPSGDEFAKVKYGAFKLQAGCIGFSIDYTAEDEKPPLYYRKDWLLSEGLKADNLVACKVKGESMEPGLYDGDTVLIDTSNQEPKDGFVSAINYEGELLIKRMHRDSGQWWLQSDNTDKTRHPNKLCGGDYCMIIGRVVNKSSSRI